MDFWQALLLLCVFLASCSLFDSLSQKSCLLFSGSDDLTHQTLMVRDDVHDTLCCQVSENTTINQTVHCDNNVTACFLNTSTLLITLPSPPNHAFRLEYGRDGEPGKYMLRNPEECPRPREEPVPSTGHTAAHRKRVFIVYAAVFAIISVVLLVLCIFIRRNLWSSSKMCPSPTKNGTKTGEKKVECERPLQSCTVDLNAS